MHTAASIHGGMLYASTVQLKEWLESTIEDHGE